MMCLHVPSVFVLKSGHLLLQHHGQQGGDVNAGHATLAALRAQLSRGRRVEVNLRSEAPSSFSPFDRPLEFVDANAVVRIELDGSALLQELAAAYAEEFAGFLKGEMRIRKMARARLTR
jgi:hypothetical protein